MKTRHTAGYAVLCFFIALLSSTSLFAQEEIVTYINKDGVPIPNKEEAAYIRKLGTQPSDQNLYELQEYYPNGQLKRKGWVQYDEPERFFLEGWIETYYKDGTIRTRIRYAENKRIDTASLYYANGQLKEQKIYVKPATGPVSHDAVIQQWYYADTKGNVLVQDGNGTAEITINKIDKEKGNFVDGYRHGHWVGTFQKGKYQFEEWYNMGKVTRGVSRDSTGKEYKYTSAMVQPEYPGGIRKLMETIADNYKYPSEAIKNKISGRMLLSFIVEKNGTPDNFKVLRNLGYGTAEAGIEAVRKAGKWKSGIERGIPVRVIYRLPLVVN